MTIGIASLLLHFWDRITLTAHLKHLHRKKQTIKLDEHKGDFFFLRNKCYIWGHFQERQREGKKFNNGEI